MSAKKAKLARKFAGKAAPLPPANEKPEQAEPLGIHQFQKTIRVLKALSQDFTVLPDGTATPVGPSVFTETQKVNIPAGNMYLWREGKKNAPLSAFFHPTGAPNVKGRHYSADGKPKQLTVIPVYL